MNTFATIRDVFNRNNFYEENYLSIRHSHEISNGLYMNVGLKNTLRKDLGDFKFNSDYDSAFENNTPYTFATHSAFESSFALSYTPKQLYIKEPKQKIIRVTIFPWNTAFICLRKINSKHPEGFMLAPIIPLILFPKTIIGSCSRRSTMAI